MKRKGSFIAMLRVTALVLLVPVAAAFAAQTPDSASISKLFHQAKDHAALANDDITFLDSSRFSGLDFRTHFLYLENVKQHAADLFRDYYKMQMLRDKGTPQQREAIDRLDPLLREIATTLTSTIQALNANRELVNMPPFRDRIHSDYLTINAVYEHLCKCANDNVKS
jgi:hypothetical protein